MFSGATVIVHVTIFAWIYCACNKVLGKLYARECMDKHYYILVLNKITCILRQYCEQHRCVGIMVLNRYL